MAGTQRGPGVSLRCASRSKELSYTALVVMFITIVIVSILLIIHTIIIVIIIVIIFIISTQLWGQVAEEGVEKRAGCGRCNCWPHFGT